jgi:seryl-tRNA synthetase
MEVKSIENGMELAERLEAAAALLERSVGWLEERQRFQSGEVDKISATVEATRREEDLLAKVEELQEQLAELRAASGEVLPKALQPLRKTLPSATAEMLAKHGIGEGVVDVRALDAALAGLSLEQRIAVKSQLRRAGAVG